MQPAAPSGPSPTRVGTGGRSTRIQHFQKRRQEHWRAEQDITDEAFTVYIKASKDEGFTSLDATNCTRLMDPSVAAVAEYWPGLTSLSVFGCANLTDASMVAVAEHCPGLTNLSVGCCLHLTDTSMVAVAEHCPGLTTLVVSRCERLTDASVVAVAKRCMGLTSLAAERLTKLTDASLEIVAEHCSALTRLDVGGCIGLTDASVIAVVERCADLKSLSGANGLGTYKAILAGTLTTFKPINPPATTHASLMVVVERCPDLVSVDLYRCKKLTDASMLAVVKKCEGLTSLGGANLKTYKTILTGTSAYFKPMNTSDVTDASLVAVADLCPGLTSIDISQCKNLTDASLLSVIKNCPGLTSLDVRGCENLTVPDATRRKGDDFILRYYQQLAKASLKSEIAKAVTMGHGLAGKTSTVRTLATLEDLSAAAAKSVSIVLTDFDDHTIALDIEELWGGKLQVYDFGGQPEYYPWQRLFLTSKTLHIIFAESSLSAELMFRQVEEQLQNLYCTVGDVPVLVVASKADLAESSEELAGKIATLKSRVEKWEIIMTRKANHNGREPNVKSDVPNILKTGFLAVSAATGEGIKELAGTIDATLKAEDDRTGTRLFPQFQVEMPIVYEHVRGFLRAVIYGEDEAVALASKTEKSGALTRKGDAQEKVCFLSLDELTTRLDAALQAAPEDFQSFFGKDGAATTLRDALVIFEGEGLVIHAEQIGLVHLVPSWLIETVKGLANHRFDIRYGEEEQMNYIEGVAKHWSENGIIADKSTSVELLHEYASNGVASERLLRAFFAPAVEKFSASFEQLLTIFMDKELLFKIDDDDDQEEGKATEPEYIVPICLDDSPPEWFERECELTGAVKACQLTGTFGCGFLPPGFAQRLIASMDKFGKYHRHYGLGGIIMQNKVDKDQPKRIFFFDLMKCQIYLRVQQLEIPGRMNEHTFIELLLKMIVGMREAVSEVANHWKGLQLEFDGKVQVTTHPPVVPMESIAQRQYTDSESINGQTHDAIVSNEEQLSKLVREELEMNEQRQEAAKRNEALLAQNREMRHKELLAQNRQMAKMMQRRRQTMRRGFGMLGVVTNTVEDAKIRDMKRFLGDISKKMPLPRRINVCLKFRGARNAIRVAFVCPRTGQETLVDSSEWSPWLKFAWLIVQTGNPIIIQHDFEVRAPSAVIEKAYAAYSEVDDSQLTFDAMKLDPILLPSEEGRLMKALLDNEFYEKFWYNDKTGFWVAVV